jgi:hypothetical protein
MDMGQLEPARRNARILGRRATRAKRSKWLGRLLFSLTGMGLLLVLRLNPEMVADAVSYAQSTRSEAAARPMIGTPSDVLVQRMPGNAVPVRKGGTLPGNGTHPAQNNTQAQAETLGQQLGNMRPGG